MRPYASIPLLTLCLFCILSTPLHADDLTHILEADLNGDGIVETIEITWMEETNEQMRSSRQADFYYTGEYTVRINDSEVTGWLDIPVAQELIDIDINDSKQEIMLTAEGPSDDPNCIIFGFDGDEIYTVARFYGLRTFDSEGTIYASVWQGFWSATQKWTLNPDVHRLEEIQQDLYYLYGCCNNLDQESGCTVTESFPIYYDPSGNEIVEMTEVGDEFRIIAGKPSMIVREGSSFQHFHWYVVVSGNGVTGWANFWDFYSRLDEGFWQAD